MQRRVGDNKIPSATKKICRKCGKEKRINQDVNKSSFHAHTFNPDGSIRLFQSWCKLCHRKYSRRRLGIKNTGKPYGVKKKRKSREEQLARRRELHAQKMQDPAYREQRREDMRMYATLRRRKKGIPAREFSKPRVYDTKIVRVPVKPFVEWFLSLNGSRPTYEQMGETLARKVHRAVYGDEDSAPLEERMMRLETVDEVAVLAGMPYIVHTLYVDI